MRQHTLDTVLSPSFDFGSSAPAVAGYPIISVREADEARQAGRCMVDAGFLQEGNLISVAYGIEQSLKARVQPEFKGEPPPEPPDAGICGAPLVARMGGLKTAADLYAMAMERGRWHRHVFPGR
jgi:hypothetical protein